MASTNLGTAEGRIRTTYDGTGAKRAKADLEGIDESGKRSSKGLNAFAKGSAIAGAALVGAFALAVKTSADFEKQISAVGAVSNATDAELGKIRETALRIGKDTKFSASEAAVAMEELAKAGVSTTDILGGAADATVALAAAGGVELPQAATIASNAMNAFNLSAKDLPRVADLIAGAANASAIDVGEFGQSLQQAGAVANTVGVPFEDLTTAIALLGNAGIKGSDAGTSLKTMLQNLNPQTAKQRDLMKELGIVTADGANRFFDAQGNVKSLADVSEVLSDSLAGMTKQQKLATLETLFGSDAIRAAAIMADAGAKGFNELAGNIGKVKAADVAAKRMDNLAGSVEQFRGSVETALIVAGAPFQTGLRQIVDLATSLVNAFANLSPGTQKIIGQFVAFGGVALLLAAGVAKTAVAFSGMGRGLSLVAKALTLVGHAAKVAFGFLLANPIALVIVAVVALIAALVLLYNKNETFRNAVQAAWQAILGAFRAVVSFFTGTVLPALSSGWNTVTAAVGAAVNFIKSAWQSLQPVIQPVISFLVNTIRNGMNVIKGIIQVVMGLITGNWTQVWNGIKNIVSGILGQIANVIRTIIGVIVGAWTSFGSRMVSAALSFIGRILTAIGTFAAQLPQRILYAIGFIIGRWLQFQVKMIAGAVKLAAGVGNAINSFFSKLPGRIASFLASALTRMVSWAANMISRARTMGSQVLSAIGSFFSQLPGRIASFLSSALSRMRTFASQLPSLARQAASGVISAISGGLAALPGIVSGAVGAAISAFQGMIGRAFSAAKSLASSLWNGFKAGLFGSPKTLIEYALIDMNEAVKRELGLLSSQSASIKRVSQSLVSDAQKALAHLGRGGAIFEDFSFKGMPKGFDNDALADAFFKANPGFDFGSKGTRSRVEAFLKKLIVTDQIAARRQALLSARANQLLLDQHAQLLKMASAVPLESGVLRVVTAAGAPAGTGGGTMNQTINVNISGMKDAQAVATVMTSSRVLRPLSQAARARGGGGAY